jgi:hypothetical protein
MNGYELDDIIGLPLIAICRELLDLDKLERKWGKNDRDLVTLVLE